MNAKPWEPVIEGKEMDGGRKEEREWENGYQALVNTAEPRIDFLLYLEKVFFFLNDVPWNATFFQSTTRASEWIGVNETEYSFKQRW